ncbi:Trp biosynthesis-associated membrane protein [Propionibacteriaceae bacterium G1746]|uniref:Trp biosynthesis-associated membrane protein n=1 Tax=Aestuariimicrobium sp. G57 TaxID=3418485 RepID=UPI003C19016D
MNLALRWAGPLLALLGGGLAAIIGGQSAGWAIVAGVVVLLVVGPLGKRAVGVLLVLVAVLLGVTSLTGTLQWAAVTGAALALVGGVLVVVTGGWWPKRRSRFERGGRSVTAGAAPLEVWKAMDEGFDPTAVDDEPVDDDEQPGPSR